MAKKILKIVEGREVRTAPEPKTNVGRHDEFGRELVDGRPMEPPVGFVESPSIQDLIARMVGSARIQQEIREAGMETEEDANDFDVGDDFDPASPYEDFYEDADLQAMIDAAKKGEPTHEVIVPPKPEGSGGAAPSEGAPEGGAAGGGSKAPTQGPAAKP